jgi:glycosyltransferase involved in cell wall biosynthesis
MDKNGLKFDPWSIDSIKTTLKRYWDNPKIRQEFSQKGLKHAKMFNWSSTARATLAVYKLALLNEK